MYTEVVVINIKVNKKIQNTKTTNFPEENLDLDRDTLLDEVVFING